MFFSQVLESTATLLSRYNVTSSTIYAAAASWGQSMMYVVVGAVVVFLASLHGGESRVATGYTLTLLYLMTPFQVIMGALPTLARAGVALDRVEWMGLRLTADGAEGDGAGRGAEESASFSLLELIGVTHSYRRENEPDSFVLGPIDLELRPGQQPCEVGAGRSGVGAAADEEAGDRGIKEVGAGHRATARETNRRGGLGAAARRHPLRAVAGRDSVRPVGGDRRPRAGRSTSSRLNSRRPISGVRSEQVHHAKTDERVKGAGRTTRAG